MIEHFGTVFNKSMLNHGIAVDLRLVNNPRGADRGALIYLQHFVGIRSESLSGNHQTVGENTRLVGDSADATDLRLLYSDVVTYPGAVTYLNIIKPGVVANCRPVAYHAGAGQTGVVVNARASEDDAIGIIYPAVAALA